MPAAKVVETREPPAQWAELAHRYGTFYHEPAWATTLSAAFRFPLHCLTAWHGETAVGALALARVPKPLGGHRLVSLPFSYAAGPAAASPDVADALARAALALAQASGAAGLELKAREALPDAVGLVPFVKYSTYLLATDGGEAAVLARLHASTRRGIRKAEASSLQVGSARERTDWLAMAYLQEATSARHGVPPPPRSFFADHCAELQRQGLADLLLARRPDGTVVAGIILWRGRREWIYAFGASDQGALEERPNHLLLWAAVQGASRAGVALDLGRAAPEQTGLVQFKERWGGQPIPLTYHYWPVARGLNTRDRRAGILGIGARLWSRLPAGLTRHGAFLYRYLG